jgi:uracil-DNA glycosylase
MGIFIKFCRRTQIVITVGRTEQSWHATRIRSTFITNSVTYINMVTLVTSSTLVAVATCVTIVTFITKFTKIVVCFLPGNSPASEFYMPTFRNTLFHLHRQISK